MTFMLDSDSIEVEGMPCDVINERVMQSGSHSLLCALNSARGLPPPPPLRPARAERRRGPPISLPPLPKALVEQYVRPEPGKPPKAPQPILGEGKGRSIIRSVAVMYEITPSELVGKRRGRHFVCARIVASRLLRDLKWLDGTPRFSLPQIGRMIGGRDHSTICYHLDVFDAYCQKYPYMRAAYEALAAV